MVLQQLVEVTVPIFYSFGFYVDMDCYFPTNLIFFIATLLESDVVTDPPYDIDHHCKYTAYNSTSGRLPSILFWYVFYLLSLVAYTFVHT